MLAILSSCAHGSPVTSVDPCIEIPFLDGPEGACTNTISHKPYIVPHGEWLAQRPHMIMIHVKHWTEIKKGWLKACRMMIRDGDRCNVAVTRADLAIKKLMNIKFRK